jgi:hypothetical protein
MSPGDAKTAALATESAIDGPNNDGLPNLACIAPTCGDGIRSASESCEGTDLGGATCATLGYAGGTLTCSTACNFVTSGCTGTPCTGPQLFPATGQTTKYVAGDDGDLEAGATLAYVDNGDGTITDTNTGLMWEKKSDDGTLHDWNNCYPWRGTCSGDGITACGTDADCTGPGGACDAGDCLVASPGGLTIFEWVAALNTASFAGHTDWRLPNVKELQSIVDYENAFPSVSAAFHTGCVPGCTVTTCSCTASNNYWSSNAYANFPGFVWFVFFNAGGVATDFNSSDYYVRAVRAGL